MFRFPSRIFPVLLLLCFLGACKETVRDISHAPEMSVRIDAFIQEMAQIEDVFPKEPGELKADSISEPLRFWQRPFRRVENCNALLVERMQLTMIDRDWGFPTNTSNYFEVGEGYSLAQFFSDRHSGSREAPEGYRGQWEDLLGLRYLVVADCTYDEPKFSENEANETKESWEALRASFSGGKAYATIAVYDRNTKSWLGGFKVEADPPEKVDFKVEQDWHFSRDLLFHIRSRTEGRVERLIKERLKPVLDKSMDSAVEQLESPAVPKSNE